MFKHRHTVKSYIHMVTLYYTTTSTNILYSAQQKKKLQKFIFEIKVICTWMYMNIDGGRVVRVAVLINMYTKHFYYCLVYLDWIIARLIVSKSNYTVIKYFTVQQQF